MGLTDNFWLWSLSRFIAGLSSAAGLLLGSGLILNWLIRNDHRNELGIHFSGIGLGIAFCSLAVIAMSEALNWSQQWWVLTLLGAVLLIPAWRWLPPPDPTSFTRSGKAMLDVLPSKNFFESLC